MSDDDSQTPTVYYKGFTRNDDAEGDERPSKCARCGRRNDMLVCGPCAVAECGDGGLRERVEALARCCCNTGPGTEGPVQECPEHGDTHARFFLGDLLRAALTTPPAPERNGEAS